MPLEDDERNDEDGENRHQIREPVFRQTGTGEGPDGEWFSGTPPPVPNPTEEAPHTLLFPRGISAEPNQEHIRGQENESSRQYPLVCEYCRLLLCRYAHQGILLLLIYSTITSRTSFTCASTSSGPLWLGLGGEGELEVVHHYPVHQVEGVVVAAASDCADMVEHHESQGTLLQHTIFFIIHS